MAVVVEDGSGLSNADTYISVADADTYISTYVRNSSTWTSLGTAAKEQALKEGTQSLDLLYGQRFVGYRRNKDQSLAWPRTAGYDTDGYAVDGTVVPSAVENATVELAWRHVNDGGPSTTTGDTTGVIADSSAGTNISSESVSVGSVTSTTQYAGIKSGSKVFRKISLILSKLIVPEGAIFRS